VDGVGQSNIACLLSVFFKINSSLQLRRSFQHLINIYARLLEKALLSAKLIELNCLVERRKARMIF
jgi:hypothetical protein